MLMLLEATMHGPKIMIIAKKEMMGDEMPDFDGDSFHDARKKMMKEKPTDSKYPEDPHDAMKAMAEELYKASKMHAGQADKLMELCEQMYGKKEEPFVASGHNPHGKKSSMY
tara:strand:+ start:64 stop:399 length:336 start_codon:yes stop_codon:yes gene_type:complete